MLNEAEIKKVIETIELLYKAEANLNTLEWKGSAYDCRESAHFLEEMLKENTC